MSDSLLARLKRLDDSRPSFPGEHWFALGAGIWLLSRRSGSILGRLAWVAAGTALVLRAASGRDGLAGEPAMRRSRGLAGGWRSRSAHERFVDIAAPWPHAERVRVTAISEPVGKSGWTQ